MKGGFWGAFFMKKFLIAISFLVLAGVSAGYAQNFDAAPVPPRGYPPPPPVENVPAPGDATSAATPPAAQEIERDPFAGMIVAKSEIKAVTVYNGRAKVTRVTEVDVPAGAHTVVFQDLPPSLLADSLRAEGSARAAVKLGAIASKQVMTTRLSSSREQEIHDQLDNIEMQRAPIQAEIDALAAQGAFLDNIGKQATLRNNENLAQIDLKPDQWLAAAQAIHNGTADVAKARALQDKKMKDLDLERDKLQRELAQIGTGQRSIFAVLLPLESDKQTKLTLSISYQVPNANWKPVYDARATIDGEPSVKLVQFGAVSQNTGEDWKGVDLTLSTAQPSRGATLPALSPMWVSLYQAAALKASNLAIDSVTTFDGGGAPGGGMTFRQMSSNVAAAPAAEMQAMPPVQPVGLVSANVTDKGFVTEYKIPGPASVPSDGSEVKLLAGTFELESKLQIHIEPQISPEAYVVMRGKLKGDAALPAGQVNLFRDEAYVGQSSIPMLRPGEETDLSFGVDDQVSVKQKLLKDERKQSGVIAKDNIVERSYVTELQNLHKTPVDIVMKETTPASQNEKIKFDLDLNDTTPGYKADADNVKGLLEWDFKMEPKEKKEVKLGWQVSWPSDYSISGL